MAAMHEHVQERTCEQQKKKRCPQDMSPVLGKEKHACDCEQA
jgi:hypothetical protein